MSDFIVLSHEECARIRADLSHAIEANALLIAENRRLREALETLLIGCRSARYEKGITWALAQADAALRKHGSQS